MIEQAKAYASEKEQSLSSLVERYFRFLAQQGAEPHLSELSPIVSELSGIIDLDDAGNDREPYTDYLVEKYR